MPILTVNLQRDAYTRDQLHRLLVGASELYARVLESPLERVRVFLNLIDPGALAVGGRIVEKGGVKAPFFEAILMEGRPAEQKRRLMQEVTDLIENVLEVERAHIRGVCWSVPPEDWCIAGTPASEKRAEEIAARSGGVRGG